LDAKEKENKELHYIQDIKNFVRSAAWKEYALPMMQQAVQHELPDPKSDGWENKYRQAFALSQAMAMIINTLSGLASKDEFMKKAEQFMQGVNAEYDSKGEPIGVDHGQPIL
jgi:hypothetical protein